MPVSRHTPRFSLDTISKVSSLYRLLILLLVGVVFSFLRLRSKFPELPEVSQQCLSLHALPSHRPWSNLTMIFAVPYVPRLSLLLDSYYGCGFNLHMEVGSGYLDECQRICLDRCECSVTPSGIMRHCDTLSNHANSNYSLMYSHADLWISHKLLEKIMQNPGVILRPKNALARLDALARMGNLGRPVPIKDACVSLDELESDTTWYWWKQSKSECAAIVRAVAPSFGKCCYGMSDLIYLPKEQHKRFRELAKAFSSVFHEVAIPTILSIMEHEQKSLEVERVQCAGSCCDHLTWAQTEDTLCAHRVDLSKTEEARKGHLTCPAGSSPFMSEPS